jgi:hypothetical protein
LSVRWRMSAILARPPAPRFFRVSAFNRTHAQIRRESAEACPVLHGRVRLSVMGTGWECNSLRFTRLGRSCRPKSGQVAGAEIWQARGLGFESP